MFHIARVINEFCKSEERVSCWTDVDETMHLRDYSRAATIETT